jgi:hypothetical protein
VSERAKQLLRPDSFPGPLVVVPIPIPPLNPSPKHFHAFTILHRWGLEYTSNVDKDQESVIWWTQENRRACGTTVCRPSPHLAPVESVGNISTTALRLLSMRDIPLTSTHMFEVENSTTSSQTGGIPDSTWPQGKYRLGLLGSLFFIAWCVHYSHLEAQDKIRMRSCVRSGFNRLVSYVPCSSRRTGANNVIA